MRFRRSGCFSAVLRRSMRWNRWSCSSTLEPEQRVLRYFPLVHEAKSRDEEVDALLGFHFGECGHCCNWLQRRLPHVRDLIGNMPFFLCSYQKFNLKLGKQQSNCLDDQTPATCYIWWLLKRHNTSKNFDQQQQWWEKSHKILNKQHREKNLERKTHSLKFPLFVLHAGKQDEGGAEPHFNLPAS